MIEVGQKVIFDPFEFISGYGIADLRGQQIKGTVVEVHEDHHWFSVEYGDPVQRTSFNFADIGLVVRLCGK
jgi:hypothetical protein